MPSNSRDSNFFGAWPRANGSGELNFSISRTSPSTPQSTPFHSKHGSPMSYPSSPISTSPTSTSPLSTLRRNYSSTFMLIPEDREIDIIQRPPSPVTATSEDPPLNVVVIRLILWWPLVIWKLIGGVVMMVLRFLFIPFSFATPTFWLSALLWLFWKMIAFPISLFKWVFNPITNSYGEEDNGKRRTILISCGSTIQTLHLARNFYSSGARVIVIEFEGLFGLARFSTAVHKFYTVPRPTPESPQEYIAALCDIIEKEKASYYIPVCATSPAYYDALAKPHLELLGCASFTPGVQETLVLDDTLEMMKKCRINGISLPPYRVVSSKEELSCLYDSGWLTGYRNIILAVGPHGILERHKYILPQSRRDLKLTHEISDEKEWIVVRDVPGDHYVTCTTVKESRVITNVTCLINQDTKSLVPENNKEIESWLNEFFTKVRLQRPINGHISFRFVKCKQTGHLLPLGSRVGVSLPYICHTGNHSRVLCKPCPHFSRQNSGPLVQEGGRYWIHDAVLNTLRHPSMDTVGKLIGTVLDKREALFAFWDPLPYCAYYHFQLPLESVKTFLQKRRRSKSMASTMTAPVH
ncbi:uncharacterized protein LOC119650981 [Hermetia illucens]|uniref:uncharacterized protein LOC119650981 n=1 Tax=Hermetia illucens TaxID=343691 RepID=UPI0018CC4192|nr:uncharacterized protein LOC119650981 [Hermetia illucens]